MPQHKSAGKRIRQSEKRRARNRQHRSRMRTMVKKLRSLTNPEEAAVLLTETKAYLDRLAGKRIIHRNTAANYKSQLEKSVNSIS